MDVTPIEHSDSDSGESWTLLENTPQGDCDPDKPDTNEREKGEPHCEKDEDTDGISIISDSDPESPVCDENGVKSPTEDNLPAQQENTPLIGSPPPLNNDNNNDNDNDNNECVKDETDFLGDKIKCKTYVHKRNHKVGSILDIIMLGTFIITAGMALGHLWSCKNECTNQTSVNAVLSNLYKLQEENAYLRNKVKLLQISSYEQQANKATTKHYRCKKIFEEPDIKNSKVGFAVKCVDENQPTNPLPNSITEKELRNNIENMKKIYNRNKFWIDAKVQKQFEKFVESQEAKAEYMKKSESQTSEEQLGPIYTENLQTPVSDVSDKSFEKVPEKRIITYADSLKIDQHLQGCQRTKDNFGKKQHQDNIITLNLNSFSEDDINDIKKDDRYTGPKVKHEKTKHDRQKSQKKQKRNNKYEQWEMKGGYLRDYDEFSVSSSQDNDNLINKPRKTFRNPVFEKYLLKLIATEWNTSKKDLPKNTKKKYEHPNKVEKLSSNGEKGKIGKNKDSKWWCDQRSALLAKARTKLAQELFGENMSNNAEWYFRRMQKREQCRAQKENNILEKLSKRKMNFKMKR